MTDSTPAGTALVTGASSGIGRELADVLANNAGVPVYGDVTETDWEDERRLLRLNVEAATELAKLYATEMVDRNGADGSREDESGDGVGPAILNTASLASLFPIPGKAVYAGSKAYLLSFSRALAHELADDGVTVTAVCPGAVETEYATRGNVEESRTMAGITNDPRSVAEAAWAGVRDGDRIVFPSAFASYGGQAVRVLPRRAVTELGERTVEEGASWF